MGIYDRDYYQEPRPGSDHPWGPRPTFGLRMPGTVVGIVILINVVVWLVDGLLTSPMPGGRPLGTIGYWLSAHEYTLRTPWMWWQLLTYGFVHAPQVSHILFNMLGLWFLGRAIEMHYGRKEFLRLYLAMLLVGSLAWGIVNLGRTGDAVLLGASGAVAGIVVLFALNFPRQTLLLFFVLPVPAWVVGVFIVVADLMGAMGTAGRKDVAYVVHLAGAAFAFLYYRFGWNLTRLTEGRFSFRWPARKWPRPRPRLRVHDPGSEESELSREVDRILEKITRHGESSLTRKERRTLERASRQYQDQRRG